MGLIEELNANCDFDEAGTFERFMGKQDLVEQFLLMFLDDPSKNGLVEAYEKGDVSMARQCSHSLKGVAANMGLMGLSNAAKDLQFAYDDGKTDVANLYEKVILEYEKSVKIISSHLKMQ